MHRIGVAHRVVTRERSGTSSFESPRGSGQLLSRARRICIAATPQSAYRPLLRSSAYDSSFVQLTSTKKRGCSTKSWHELPGSFRRSTNNLQAFLQSSPTSHDLPSDFPAMIIRPTARPQVCNVCSARQIRHATLLRRPKRPYTFTQLVTLSDGSTFTQRTTSPLPVLRSTKDVRNSALWNPSSQKLLNIEEDEAGRLARFRERFGRGWDAEAVAGNEEVRSVVT